jgi:glycosyltransferase involved in cell wall biosynthesis
MSFADRLLRRSSGGGPRVAFNMQPLDQPWGGGNWWLTQMVRHLETEGHDVRFDLKHSPDFVVVVDPRVGGNVGFAREEIEAHRERHPEVRVLHRINEGDLHREKPMLDDLLADVNQLADHTVFISEWIRDYHAKRWFDRSRPHSVIHNGADPAVFHPGAEELRPGGTMRLVTHHWSNNPRKGFDVYQEVDRLIADGEIEQTELWVVGRWPDSCEWRAARTFAPARGEALADLLRQCHVYLTASRFEAGAMHFIEGVQCGLPLLYHEDGGGIVELGRRYGIGFRNDVAGAIGEMRGRYDGLRRAVLADPPSGEAMCRRYTEVIDGLVRAPAGTSP